MTWVSGSAHRRGEGRVGFACDNDVLVDKLRLVEPIAILSIDRLPQSIFSRAVPRSRGGGSRRHRGVHRSPGLPCSAHGVAPRSEVDARRCKSSQRSSSSRL